MVAQMCLGIKTLNPHFFSVGSNRYCISHEYVSATLAIALRNRGFVHYSVHSDIYAEVINTTVTLPWRLITKQAHISPGQR
jgi:hypothetical protein